MVCDDAKLSLPACERGWIRYPRCAYNCSFFSHVACARLVKGPMLLRWPEKKEGLKRECSCWGHLRSRRYRQSDRAARPATWQWQPATTRAGFVLLPCSGRWAWGGGVPAPGSGTAARGAVWAVGVVHAPTLISIQVISKLYHICNMTQRRGFSFSGDLSSGARRLDF